MLLLLLLTLMRMDTPLLPLAIFIAAAAAAVVFVLPSGEEFEDQALVLLRGATSCGHLGVWPAAALINHSCAPNCHAMLLGDRLVRWTGGGGALGGRACRADHITPPRPSQLGFED